VAEYPPGARNVWFWQRRPDRQDSYVSHPCSHVVLTTEIILNIVRKKKKVKDWITFMLFVLEWEEIVGLNLRVKVDVRHDIRVDGV
jgi:hypothetical protein